MVTLQVRVTLIGGPIPHWGAIRTGDDDDVTLIVNAIQTGSQHV